MIAVFNVPLAVDARRGKITLCHAEHSFPGIQRGSGNDRHRERHHVAPVYAVRRHNGRSGHDAPVIILRVDKQDHVLDGAILPARAAGKQRKQIPDIVSGLKSLTATGTFFGYTPPVTVTLSPTCRIMPIGLLLPSPVT